MNEPNVCIAFHPKVAGYTHFLLTHGTFSRADHIIKPQIKFHQIEKD